MTELAKSSSEREENRADAYDSDFHAVRGSSLFVRTEHASAITPAVMGIQTSSLR